MEWWGVLLISLGTLILGAVGGFFGAVKYFKNYTKKNPPINEAQVRVMMQQMGRTPSEKQVRQVMQAMQNAK